jgi:hypothetical protein
MNNSPTSLASWPLGLDGHDAKPNVVTPTLRLEPEAEGRSAARGNVANVASRQTLQKAGLLLCGRLLNRCCDSRKIR